MTNTTIRMMLAATALVVAAGTASAQSYTAEIPIAFHVGSKLLAPGSYEIQLTQSVVGPVAILHNRAGNGGAAFAPGVVEDVPKRWLQAGLPTLSFECVNGSCRLNKMWSGGGSHVYSMPARKPAKGDLVARNEVVTLTMIKAR